MERIKRKTNPSKKKIVRCFLLFLSIIAIIYGYVRVPYFVVKRNLTLQNNYTYSTYDKILKKRKLYLTRQYYDRFTTLDSAIERLRYIKEHKENCYLTLLEIGEEIRGSEGVMIPYTVVYKVNYEDGVTPAQQVHIEGVQKLERTWLIWWKVDENEVIHACTDLFSEIDHMHESKWGEHNELH